MMTRWTVLLLFAAALSTFCRLAPGHAAQESALTLQELERLAHENNPSLAQAEGAVRMAEGRTLQAGLLPNPVVGYQGEDISLGNPSERSAHFGFVEQRIVTGGKLRHGKAGSLQETRQAEAEREAQRLRVLNTVRILYYRALGAQQLVELHGKLADLVREGVAVSKELYNLGQADSPDVLQVEIDAQHAEISLANARNNRERLWNSLAAAVGVPDLPVSHLEGDLEGNPPKQLDREKVLAAILENSPELAAARAGVEQSRSGLESARAARIPDVSVRVGFGYNNEMRESQGLVEVGVPLPLFDRNQGGIAAAGAGFDRARQEVRRVELDLRSRLATTFTSYRNSMEMAERYRSEILPRAHKSYDLYLKRFHQMAAAYPQALIARRTLFQSRIEYVNALVDLHESIVALEGMLLVDSPASR